MPEFAACPQCSKTMAKQVGFTWWGGALGPRMLHHVKCEGCGTTYNGKTGKSNSQAIAMYFVVTLVIFAGVIHWVTAPLCQFSPWEKLRQVPAMIRGVGPASAARLGSWLAAWGRHDPAEPHIHLGPIGVDPAYQGKNVGRLLMEAYCAELDRGGVKGYLETDRAENVTFYQRFGFQVTREAPVLGVTNYFMTR